MKRRISMKEKMKLVVALALFLAGVNCLFAKTISRSFELRYVSDAVAADGPSGFKGGSSVFDNNQRLEYLRDRFDILLEKRLSGVADLRYKRLYGKSQVNRHF
jgi:hypothetical protein